LTFKANHQTLYRQIRSQFQGKRKIPFVATDQEISHGRDITWTLRAKQAPEHIREAWIGTSWIVAVCATGTRDGKPFCATHLFLTSLRSTPEALLQLVRECWSIEGWHWIRVTQLHEGRPPLPRQRRRRDGDAADGGSQPAAADRLSVDQGRHAGGDARHHGAADDGDETTGTKPGLKL